jgi:hypothetical protein
MPFDAKKLFDQLARDPVPVKCGEVFDVIVEGAVILSSGSCDMGPTDEEDHKMYFALQEDWLRKAQRVCDRAGASCPKPQEGGGSKLLENNCEYGIWTMKWLFKTKCTA